MRRSDKAITDRTEIERILSEAPVCRLGLVDGNLPYVVPVFFAFEAGVLYFHSALEGRKRDILRKQPQVCFETETGVEILPATEACRFGASYRSIIGFGKAMVVESVTEKEAALNRLMRKYAGKTFGFSPEALSTVLVFRIEIESIAGKRSG